MYFFTLTLKFVSYIFARIVTASPRKKEMVYIRINENELKDLMSKLNYCPSKMPVCTLKLFFVSDYVEVLLCFCNKRKIFQKNCIQENILISCFFDQNWLLYMLNSKNSACDKKGVPSDKEIDII